MGISRQNLKDLGLSDDQIDSVMSQYGKSIQSYRADIDNASSEMEKLKSELGKYKTEIEGLKKAREEFKVTESAEYKELQSKFTDLENKGKLSSLNINPKYVEFVKGKIDFNDFDKSAESLKKDYPEFFNEVKKEVSKENTKQAPVFSSQNTDTGRDLSEDQNAEQNIRKLFGLK